MKIEEFDKALRDKLLYFGYMIQNEIEWIEGLESFDIDNEELERHYNLLKYFICDGACRIQKLYDDFLGKKD
ncbi:MAG: hypothetical protein GX963_15880 [Bacteroidales bacterium]|nr:hypothetical protein [Bacteroidales bacterium]